MKSKVLLRDIPAGKFHSAICTTYSINFYYLEQQILPLLASKGVHYVSLLADGNMLSSQLGTYTTMSESRKRNYALHGVQCNGAFHPKLIFLAGDRSLLLLIGSGNLTSGGHGRNLESWSAVYVDDQTDEKLGLLIDSWSFINTLYSGLGTSAKNALSTIAANCELLNMPGLPKPTRPYPNGDAGSKISFLATQKETSLVDQLVKRIDGQQIKAIHIMSPYYDLEGQFIHQLQTAFEPKRINIVLQDKFGMPPYLMKPIPSVRFFLWQEARNENFKQPFFHAKHIIFEGAENNFLFTGSANASVAAFGGPGFSGQNVEAGILYEGPDDFPALLGFQFSQPTQLSNIEVPDATPPAYMEFQSLAYIKAIEKELDVVTIYIETENVLTDVKLTAFTANGAVALEESIELNPSEPTIVNCVKNSSLLYAELRVAGRRISNKQFIVDVTAFEATNPSPQNRSLNQIRKLIEGGSFSSHKIIEYLNTIHQQQTSGKPVQVTPGGGPAEREKWYHENQELINLSYAEIQERIREMEHSDDLRIYTTYKSVRLWDSIFSYLKDAKAKREESSINEEETEDLNRSTGRITEPQNSGRKTITRSNFNKLKEKVENFLDDYIATIQDNIRNDKAVKPTLVDLTMFLIVLEILLHLFSHKETTEDETEATPLLDLEFSDKFTSWSDYLNHTIGSFTLWCAQKDGLKTDVNDEYNAKITAYLDMAFKTVVSALSIFSLVNKNYNRAKIDKWKMLNLKNAAHYFGQPEQSVAVPEDFLFFIPEQTKEELGEDNLKDELRANLLIIQTELGQDKWYEHPEDGITFIEKRVPSTPDVKFLKLIHPGYEWHGSLKDHWNGEVFSLIDWRWRKSL